jgi:hypothetical protein
MVGGGKREGQKEGRAKRWEGGCRVQARTNRSVSSPCFPDSKRRFRGRMPLAGGLAASTGSASFFHSFHGFILLSRVASKSAEKECSSVNVTSCKTFTGLINYNIGRFLIGPRNRHEYDGGEAGRSGLDQVGSMTKVGSITKRGHGQ